MTEALRFLSETEEDILSGYIWYEEKVKGLGEEFERVVYSCTAEIVRNPFIYPKVEGELRRCLVKKFPYSIYFLIEEDAILICGFFHCARDPERLMQQMQDRTKDL
jgi:toxin ParE1/3/4